MTNVRLAEAFLDRAKERLQALDVLRDEADHSDVIREARDIVDLCFRGMLRIMGLEVSRYRDVGEVLLENIGRLPAEVREHEDRIREVYADLTKQRAIEQVDDGTPVERLLLVDADRATAGAQWILSMAQLTLDIVAHRKAPASR
jgi:HEPN domain-containing protein